MTRFKLHIFTVMLFFFFNDPATTDIYTLSLHDALPISPLRSGWSGRTSPPPRAWFDGSARRPPPIPRRAGSCDGRTPTARAWPAGSWSWSRTDGWSSPTAGRTAGWACRPRAPPWRSTSSKRTARPSCALTIRLLGPPAIERDSGPAPPPRGRKAWALLAYLLLADRPPGRRHLAELLFSDADDPLGALQWTLAELRRALGAPGLLGGDPVATTLGPGLDVDLHAVTVEPADPAPLLELGGDLLEGISIAASPAFESWLVVERHWLAAAVEARLREAALSLLASGRAEAAVAYAARVVARNPLGEGNHELLVRSLAAAGD